MGKKTKIIILALVLLVIVATLLATYFAQVPCGGMTEQGYLWDGRCAYGPLLIENVKNGNGVWDLVVYFGGGVILAIIVLAALIKIAKKKQK